MSNSLFTIEDDFYLDKEPYQVISGGIHYFRVVPEYWQDRLEKLKNMGCNTVETYIPWNMHEPEEGRYDFSGQLDIAHFVRLAHRLGLKVIVRPSPYICAEWEFGGLPYWLLKDRNMRIRCHYPPFLLKVSAYFKELFKQLVPLQVNFGGPIIMMQVENEFGGYGNDQMYLKKIAEMMKEEGVVVPLVTSDGPWHDMLANGSIPTLALPTINCGSGVAQHFERLATFHGQKRPLMVMEFWIGWFDAWGDKEHHLTDTVTAQEELRAILSRGHVNIYMFHGGTNFGFLNGANYYDKLLPDTTSYDYDAPLNEYGELTEKYQGFKEVISEFKTIEELPLTTTIKQRAYGTISVSQRVSLFETLATFAKPVTSDYTLTMEDLDQPYGYVLYTSELGAAREINDFRLVGAADRANIFVNQEHIVTKYDQELVEAYTFTLTSPTNQIQLLLENMGRVNYSVKMEEQRKGINRGVIINGAFQSQWQHYVIDTKRFDLLDFDSLYVAGQPSFHKFIVTVAEIGDTFVDMTGWGKGFVVINGFNLGRFWEIGPQTKLYLPGPLLKKGQNTLIIFETEGKVQETISLVSEPDIKNSLKSESN